MPATDGVSLEDSCAEQRSELPPHEPEVQPAVGVTRHKGHTTVTLAGQMDPSAVDSLHQLLVRLTEEDRDIQIDCSEVQHLPASVLQVLLAAQAALSGGEKSGGGRRSVRIDSESPGIRAYLDLAGLAGQFPPNAAAGPVRRKRAARVRKQT